MDFAAQSYLNGLFDAERLRQHLPAFPEELIEKLVTLRNLVEKTPPAVPTEDGHLAWVLARLGQYEIDPRLEVISALLDVSPELQDILTAELTQVGWTWLVNVEEDPYRPRSFWEKDGLYLGFQEDAPCLQNRPQGNLYRLIPFQGRGVKHPLPVTEGLTHSTPVDPALVEIAWALAQSSIPVELALQMAQRLLD